jgi:hypothetical protein
MILFQSAASVFEILWDIVLVLLLFRISFLYFALTFLTGCILGYLRVTYLIPSLGIDSRTGELIEMPFMLLSTVVWTKILMTRFDIPAAWDLRLIIGFMAAGLMLVAELIGSIILYEGGWREVMIRRDPVVGSTFAFVLVLFGLMPWIFMQLELRDKANRTASATSDMKDALITERWVS